MVRVIDLGFRGRPGVIAAGLLDGPEGLVIVDPGPASTLETLGASLADLGRSMDEVRAILVTHIHLDHSGGVGVLLHDQPGIRVFVHERGAPHIIDPSKLVASAGRLYGDRMKTLWGDIVPVPASAVEPLRGDEVLHVAGLEVRVAYTPGHASHHVSYLDTSSDTAFVGDTGGVRLGAPLLVVPPTPPPDIDVDAWVASVALIRAWRPGRVFVTHFGEFDDADAHLSDLEDRLREVSGIVRSLLAEEQLDDRQRQAAFVARLAHAYRSALPDEEWVQHYLTAVPVDNWWQGLARYWRAKASV
jgi:glyoxylase-like metal-dependent hydrolase (beta-lactamase superfamily II)